MTNRHCAILKLLNFGKGYQMYSWKHTGAVAAVKAGIGVKELQIQLRHHSLDETDKYEEYKVKDLMFIPTSNVGPEESMDEVAKKFTKSGYYNMPVIKDGKYWGFVSRATVFSAYRKLLKDFSDD